MRNHQESFIQQNSVKWFDAAYMNKYTWRIEVEVKKNCWKTQRVSLLMKLANEAKRTIAGSSRVLAEGLSTGAADMFLAIGKQHEGVVLHHGLFIEFKAVNQKQTKAQEAFQEKIEQSGYKYVVAKSFDEFKEVVEEYLGTNQ